MKILGSQLTFTFHIIRCMNRPESFELFAEINGGNFLQAKKELGTLLLLKRCIRIRKDVRATFLGLLFIHYVSFDHYPNESGVVCRER